MGFEHGMESVQESAHDGDQGLRFGFAAPQKVLTEGPQVRFTPPCGGSRYYFDVPGASSWSSTNTGVFTLNNTNLKGLLTGVGGGSATANSQGPTECAAWYLLGNVCQCSSQTHPLGTTPCSVMDFTIVPGSFQALCDGQREVVVYKSSFNCSGSCSAVPPPASYCSATSSSGIDIQVGYPVYSVDPVGQLNCQVNFFTTSGGTITPTLTVTYSGTLVTQTKSRQTPISCP
jgi:hypothetical protein